MCLAVGQNLQTMRPIIERWNGSSWSVVPSPNPGAASTLNAVACMSSTDCFAVGEAGTNPLAERWNGTSWKIAALPTTAGAGVLNAITCPSATNCFAVGTLISISDDASGTLVERWNGANWSLAPSPNSSGAYNTLSDVSCTSSSNCMAVGGSQTFFRDNRRTLAQRWNGSTWVVVSSPNRPGYNELSSVACVSATNCTAVGKSANGTGGSTLAESTLAETWNGTRWSLASTPNRSGAYNSRLNGLACPASNICFAVGSSSTDVAESTLVERTPLDTPALLNRAGPTAQTSGSAASRACVASRCGAEPV